jgi:hypothetical protein
MCEKYLYGSEGGAGNDRPYPYLRQKTALATEQTGWLSKSNPTKNSVDLINHPVRSR